MSTARTITTLHHRQDFSWNVPWFGEGKTVLRGGYGISYEGALRNFITVDGVISTVPGINLISGGTGLTYTPATFTNTSTLTLPIPFPTGTPTSSPFPVPTTARNLGITTYDMVSPYTQNWNLEVQRELTKRMSVSVRYVGTKGTKITSNVDLNTLGWYKNENTAALLDAFNTVRQGGESPLLDQIFNGIGFTGTCVGGTVTAGVTCTGAHDCPYLLDDPRAAGEWHVRGIFGYPEHGQLHPVTGRWSRNAEYQLRLRKHPSSCRPSGQLPGAGSAVFVRKRHPKPR